MPLCTGHIVHRTEPSVENVSSGQSKHPVRATVSLYNPAGQLTHAAVDVLLYWPAAHAVQLLAFAAASVSVTDPAGHTAHATVDTLLY